MKKSSATVLVLGALALSGCKAGVDVRTRSDHRSQREQSTESIPLDGADKTLVEVRLGAGELRVEGGATQLMEGDFRYGSSAGKPEIRHTKSGSHSVVSITQQPGINFGPNEDVRWDVRLTDKQPVELIANLGAGEARFNLGSLDLRNLEIHMGVGALLLDLRGNPKHDYDVEVHGGVGEANIRVPKDVAIEAEAKGGIGDISVRGLEKRKGRWVNPAHLDGPVAIRLNVSGGVGAIQITAE